MTGSPTSPVLTVECSFEILEVLRNETEVPQIGGGLRVNLVLLGTTDEAGYVCRDLVEKFIVQVIKGEKSKQYVKIDLNESAA